MPRIDWRGSIVSGAGGATPAFLYADGRRIDELERVLGVRCHPGSLNVRLRRPFNWHAPHLKADILDVVDRARGIGSEWAPRPARLYPVTVDGNPAWIFRFEGERYPPTFIELVAPMRLRDVLERPEVSICLSS